MGGLGNLKRDDKRRNQSEKNLSKIQKGASFKSKDANNSTFKRYTFSLTTEIAGSRYFCESLFWASEPKQAAKT